MNSPARRLCLLGTFLVVPLVAAVGLAWACVPTARIPLTKTSGPAGTQTTMNGSGFPDTAVKVDIYLDTKNTGQLLKDDHPIAAGNFTTDLTMPTVVGAHLLIPVPFDVNGADLSASGGAGTGPPAAAFQVTDPSLTAAPGAGRAGGAVTVSGAQFRSGTVRLHWDSAGGPQIGSATATGANSGFTKPVAIPASAAGAHRIVGVPVGDPTDTAAVNVQVLPPPPIPIVSGDRVGPAIVAAALSRGNGTKTVSSKGVVTIFCGQFDEPGVTGECGAKSSKKLKVGSAGKTAVLKLGAKRFSASQGKPVKLKFRLKKASLKMLKKAKRVRMRGSVAARDAGGNASGAVPFAFTLKAPKARGN